jgi:hypothetical protein
MSKRYCYWCGSELKNYHSHAKVTGAMGHSQSILTRTGRHSTLTQQLRRRLRGV